MPGAAGALLQPKHSSAPADSIAVACNRLSRLDASGMHVASEHLRNSISTTMQSRHVNDKLSLTIGTLGVQRRRRQSVVFQRLLY